MHIAWLMLNERTIVTAMPASNHFIEQLDAMERHIGRVLCKGTPSLRHVAFHELTEHAVAFVLACDRTIAMANRLAVDNERKPVPAYGDLRQHVTDLLLLDPDRDDVGPSVRALARAAGRVRRPGGEMWAMLDEHVGVSEIEVDVRDRSSLPYDESPARELVEEAQVVLSTLPRNGRSAPSSR